MGKFRSLFKVRRPGNGDAFQKKVEAAGNAPFSVPHKDNSQNSGGKEAIKQ